MLRGGIRFLVSKARYVLIQEEKVITGERQKYIGR
jgi:hypothetical protein